MHAPVGSTHVYLSHTNVFKMSDRAPSPETCFLQGNAFVFNTLLVNPAGGNCWRCLCPCTRVLRHTSAAYLVFLSLKSVDTPPKVRILEQSGRQASAQYGPSLGTNCGQRVGQPRIQGTSRVPCGRLPRLPGAGSLCFAT